MRRRGDFELYSDVHVWHVVAYIYSKIFNVQFVFTSVFLLRIGSATFLYVACHLFPRLRYITLIYILYVTCVYVTLRVIRLLVSYSY